MFLLATQALHVPCSEKFNEKVLSRVKCFITTRRVYRNMPISVSRAHQIDMVPLGTFFLMQYAVFF